MEIRARRSRFAGRRILAVAGAGLLMTLVSVGAAADAPEDEDERRRPRPRAMRVYHFEADMMEGSFGATPGGAQDITFTRDRVAAGEIPHPRVFTPEGLFSEHDLPVVTGEPCRALLCVEGEAAQAQLLVQPEVTYLAQVGFSSGLDPKTFRRAPLNLMAVVDRSGSMSGAPIDTVRKSLHHLVEQLRDDDQLGIVLYGSSTVVHLAPSSMRDRPALHEAVDRIAIDGSTYMEAGLKLGFATAAGSARDFDGTTRVMLFTDERPNVGRTDAESFMGMARAASEDGIGMTTIGVGVQFGAELATAISSVRGGNLFFFPDAARMEKVFHEDFDTMVTELAYAMRLEFRAAPGLKIAGVYGIPGKMLEWTDDGALRVSIETIFLSRKKGAIYLALKSDGGDALPPVLVPAGRPAATVALSYEDRAGDEQRATRALTVVDPDELSPGLRRGVLLVNEVTVLKEATRLHHEENKQEDAYQLVHAIASIFRQVKDDELASEREMLEKLEHTLARLSGHLGEPTTTAAPGLDPVSGLPVRE